jgi:hypothetical protein
VVVKIRISRFWRFQLLNNVLPVGGWVGGWVPPAKACG